MHGAVPYGPKAVRYEKREERKTVTSTGDIIGVQEKRSLVNRILSVFVAGFMICMLVACLNKEGTASTATNEKSLQNEAHGLALSDMKVKITSLGHTATFQLYDTVAAKEFYD